MCIKFPFLFGGTFIEGLPTLASKSLHQYFPSFSEGLSLRDKEHSGGPPPPGDFPSFSEGLSLRGGYPGYAPPVGEISLPFRRDFH